MTITQRILSLLACLALAACAAEGDPDDIEGLDDTSATSGSPCGTGAWVASLETATQSTVDFCLFEDGLFALRETGALDVRSSLNAVSPLLCADRVYAALAPGKPIPQALVDACRDSTTALVLSSGDGGQEDTELDDLPVPLSHYCSSDGADEFEDERCSEIEFLAEGYDSYDVFWWCKATSSTWSQRTATSQIGHKVNKLRAQVAACTASTDVKLRAKVGGSWHTYVHDLLSENYWGSWSVSTTTSITDLDMQFIGESENGFFRSAGYFRDILGP